MRGTRQSPSRLKTETGSPSSRTGSLKLRTLRRSSLGWNACGKSWTRPTPYLQIGSLMLYSTDSQTGPKIRVAQASQTTSHLSPSISRLRHDCPCARQVAISAIGNLLVWEKILAEKFLIYLSLLGKASLGCLPLTIVKSRSRVFAVVLVADQRAAPAG